MVRSCSHCPAKFFTSSCERGSATMRRTCCSSTPGSAKLPLRGQADQLVVRTAAPQEERQARCQFQVADAIGLAGLDVGRTIFGAEHKFRMREDELEPALDAVLEIARIPAGLIETQQRLGIRIGNGPAISLPRECRENLSRAGQLICGARGLADEDLAAAGRVWSGRVPL